MNDYTIGEYDDGAMALTNTSILLVMRALLVVFLYFHFYSN